MFCTLALAVAACAGGGSGGNSGNTKSSQENASGGKLTKLTFSLDFIADGRYAPFYLALKKGYYKKEGLDVKIIASKGSAAVVQALASGNAQIGYDDESAFLLGLAGGAKMTMVSIQYQKAPYAVYSLKSGANLTKPSQLEGLTITSNAGSFTPKVIKGFMAQQGLDPKKVKFNDVDPSTKNSLLASGRVPAIETYIMSKPALAKSVPSDKKLVTFLLADHGLKLYGNGIVVPNSYLKSNGDVVRKFVKAS
ncbi:MAG: ABC transporter substrate-binding protein, partial [Nocardioidaceae bacterium]